jgi:hypothetical protein
MKRIRSGILTAAALALVSTTAFAAESAVVRDNNQLAQLADATRIASQLPGLPLTLSAALTAVSVTAEPAAPAAAPVSPRMMKVALPVEMIVVARDNEYGELETLCVDSQAAADAFTNRKPIVKKEQ